jgi:nucleotide-binding universal stress UspA family protein
MAEDPSAKPSVQPGLQANAIGFLDAVSIGLNATSPAYSLAAVLGPIVEAAVIQARAAGLQAEAVLVDDDPVGALEAAMEQHRPRMLIVGYGQSGRIRAALFGTVADKIVDSSDVPVLVVP